MIGDTACDQEVAKIVSGIEDVVTDDSVSANQNTEAEMPAFTQYSTRHHLKIPGKEKSTRIGT